ncbi:MAG: glycoside hydrolase family 13 protein [Propionibacteriaceae bacterium]|nr:glycoside hydrolase family 13 protein [Propionibacteriaceae bacterium]
MTTTEFPRTPSDLIDPDTWWRRAVVYQVYPRSFADSNGDGVGDVNGIRSRLPYLAGLGVDAVWISPWYPSPMKDAGYDVSNYRDIEPVFGTLAEAEALIAEAHEVGIKVIIDIVPNHFSDQHPLFVDALAAGPGSGERERFVFREGRGADGELPPNDWRSEFGGPAWSRTTNPDGTPGQWYLHLFTPEQPDVNWNHADIKDEFDKTLRFWFDRGADGFRIDVAHGLVKDDTLIDAHGMTFPLPADTPADVEHPHWDRPGVHDIYRAWRKVANEYTPARAFVAEAWVGRPERLAQYIRPDELHTAFNFEFLKAPWIASRLREVIDATLASHLSVGAPATWVLANHDVPREVTRYARPQETLSERVNLDELLPLPADFGLGLRRARAAALLMLALPGSAYIYEGEELGLPEVEDIPAEALQDPIFAQTGGQLRGRDGCRVPIPWTSDPETYGFSPAGAAAPWLPQPAAWAGLSVTAQQDIPDSTLELYRAALRLRHQHPALGDGSMTWVEAGDKVLAFRREPGFECWVNLGAPLPLPADADILVASEELTDRVLPTDAAVWLAC